MIFIKYALLLLIFLISTTIGNLKSKKYYKRVEELIEMKNALNIFKTKIKFTYEPIPVIFEEIGMSLNGNIAELFCTAHKKMNEMSAGQAWEKTVDTLQTNMNGEDINVLKKLGKLLGKTDLDGQISEIDLNSTFLDTQIKKAEEERKKNEKLYKTLGLVMGLTIVIILV